MYRQTDRATSECILSVTRLQQANVRVSDPGVPHRRHQAEHGGDAHPGGEQEDDEADVRPARQARRHGGQGRRLSSQM